MLQSYSHDSANAFPSKPPILKLDEDILWRVFMINTKTVMPADKSRHPLSTCRHSSQVCRLWRSIILGSPALWGRLVDLDHLNGKNSCWRDEILCRSGDAVLWVRGHVRDRHMWEYLLSICDTHLARIQHLQITIAYTKSYQADRSRLSDALHRPAPLLTTFKFEGNIGGSLGSPLPLFANVAPLLEVFVAGGFKFNLCAPWLSNLREICISEFFALADVLAALKFMPFLECICLNELDKVHKEMVQLTPLPSVHLPQLRILEIESVPLHICLLILEHLSPAGGCSLQLSIQDNYPYQGKTNKMLRAASEQLSRYIQQCITFQAASSIQLFCDSERFQLFLYNGDKLHFGIETHGCWDFLQIFLVYIALSSFISLVTEAGLTLSDPPPHILVQLTLLLGSLGSVTTLNISELELKCAHSIMTNMNNPFPKLHTVVLDHILEKDESVIEVFLEQREAIGLPVSVLDLTKVSFGIPNHLNFLKGMSGLKVLESNEEL
ncbi:hypothetical protein GALMADRAFT_145837 [Galerina marginata CBS 339.88]|uniref:F-box domain-containing protein n=1 Tax=Galerina marginata (strain CBS 339.88) TaxID=685588 RepID=A0A067SQR8_GALM3|nr:hypothetical protein GALMADRAFT_145837 [Galerina marginata CBS 339.88]